MNNIATSKTAAGINYMECEAKLSIDWSSMELLIHESPWLYLLAIIGTMTQEPLAFRGGSYLKH